MTDFVAEFSDVFMEHMGFLNPGRIKFSDQQVGFKNTKTGKVDQISVSKIAECQWIRLATRPGVKIILDDGRSYRFGGFNDSDQEKIRNFVKKNWKLDLAVVDHSIKGWNYGRAKFEGQAMEFEVSERLAFEVPLANVSNCTTQKNEVVMEYHKNEDCPVSLMEMRFHIPAEAAEGEDDPVEEFRRNIMRHAGVVQETDRVPLAEFEELLCATPRGRYDIKIFPTHLSLHGKTYDYKIPIKTILRMFLLPHKDGQRMFFVVSLDPPIRQGQTRYPFLVLEFTKDGEIDLELGLTEEQLQEKYGGKLTKQMSGPVYELLSRIMRSLLNQRITVPGSFVGHSGTPAVSCAYKQAAGFLYPLEKGFMYVHKPPMYVRFEEVSNVNFARSDVSTRSFDFEIETKQGAVFNFNGVVKEEYTRLFDFVSKKNLRINAGKQGALKVRDEFKGSSDEEEEELDPYKERLKQEAREREQDEDEEESDSEDEDSDYKPDQEEKKKRQKKKEKGDKESGSEPDLEYDSDASESSESGGVGDAEESPKKKKKKKPSPEKKRTQKPPAKQKEGGKKKRAKKDPNAPKKAQSAYFLWFTATREKIKEPGMSITDIAKKGGELWKKMEDKSVWEKKALEDKKRYEREMAEFKKKQSTTPTKSNVKSKEYVSSDGSSDSGKPSVSQKKKSDSEKSESNSSKDSDSE